MTMAIELITGILTKTALGRAIDDMGKIVSSVLSSGEREVSVTFYNQTQFEVIYSGSSYFDSGRFDTPPTNVQPFSTMTFSGCSKDDSILTGVSGGACFQLQLMGTDNSTQELDVAIGFTNPEIGSNKASASFGSDPRAAYNGVTDSSTQAKSGLFLGTDTNGNATTIQFMLASAPGTTVSITLTQMIVSGGS